MSKQNRKFAGAESTKFSSSRAKTSVLALRSFAKFVLFFSIGLGILYLFQRGLSAEEKAEIWKSFSNVRYWSLLCIVVSGLLSNIFRTLRWQMLIETVEKKPNTVKTFLAIMVGYFANLAVPRLGEVIRCTLLYRYEKIPVQKAIGTVIIERAIDVLLFILVFILAFVIEYESLKDYVSQNVLASIASKASFMNVLFWCAIGAVMLCVILYFVYRIYKEKMAQNVFFQKIKKTIKGFGEGLSSLYKLKKKGLFILYSVLIWVCYWLMMLFAFLSMPEMDSFNNISISLVALAMGTIGIMLTPGGIGVYPVIIAQTLAVFACPIVVGYAAGWLAWGVQTGVIIIGGLLSLICLGLLERAKKKTDKPC